MDVDIYDSIPFGVHVSSFRSDVLGQFMPLVGKDWTHFGTARLFSAIKVLLLHLYTPLVLQNSDIYLCV